MKAPIYDPRQSGKSDVGFTLLELIVSATILSILTMMALPLARITIQREKEKQLRKALWEMRDAIDNYKQAGERGAFQIKADSGGYPPLQPCFELTPRSLEMQLISALFLICEYGADPGNIDKRAKPQAGPVCRSSFSASSRLSLIRGLDAPSVPRT
jgi:prepilin-type N-terminal cleavage/methylation domain-containing protein